MCSVLIETDEPLTEPERTHQAFDHHAEADQWPADQRAQLSRLRQADSGCGRGESSDHERTGRRRRNFRPFIHRPDRARERPD